MEPMDMLWRGVGIPILASAVTTGVAVIPWIRSAWPQGIKASLAAAAATLGYLLGHLALSNWSWPGLPPLDTAHWPFFLAVAALALTLWEQWRSPREHVRWSVRGILAAATLAAVARPQLQGSWSVPYYAGATIAAATVTVLWWAGLEATVRRLPRAASLLLLLGLLCGASLILVLSGTGLVAQLTGALAAAMGPLLLIALWRPELPVHLVVVPLTVVTTAALWSNGLLYTYADLRLPSALLAATPAVTLGTVLLPPVRRMAASPRALLRWSAASFPLLASAVLIAIALVLAYASSPELAY